MLEFEYLCDCEIDVGEIVTMAPGPHAERRIVAILGGNPWRRLRGSARWQHFDRRARQGAV